MLADEQVEGGEVADGASAEDGANELVAVKVHRLVTCMPVMGDDGEEKFELKVESEALRLIQQAVRVEGIENEAIYPVSVIGYTSDCHKAVALNSAGTASLERPRRDEKLVQFGFECSDEARGPFGIFVSEPIKRYGKWYIMMNVDFPNNDGSGVVRMRSLALHLSAGGRFKTCFG